MKKLQGIPLASGLAMGKCSLIDNFIQNISAEKIDADDIDEQLEKFEQGIKKSLKELKSLQSLVDNNSEQHEIIQSHQEILKDKELKDDIRNIIKDELYSVELAIHTYFENFLKSLSNVDDEYLSLRKADFWDIRNNLIKNIQDEKGMNIKIEPETIAVVEALPPSLAMNMFNADLLGLVVEHGSKNSHSAILAKSIGIPVIYDVKNATREVAQSTKAIIDGQKGTLILEPNEKQKENYTEQKKQRNKQIERYKSLAKSEAITKDNKKITVMANIELAEETNKFEVKYSDGVGLFRTEFLYFLENKFPSVEKQAEIYKRIIDNLDKNKPIFIRVFDIGGDKLKEEFGLQNEENPNLGRRGIRFLLEYRDIFKDQLKGILTASNYGNIKIMLPMISRCEEVFQSREILELAKNELDQEGTNYDKNIDLGILIEVPSAALVADKMAKICDFFSIGTNDLTQYVLAADRNNERFGEDYTYFHRGIILLIKNTIDAARANNIPVSICGEMGSDPIAIPLLLGMGMNMVSINTDQLLPIKKIIKKYSVEEQKQHLKKVMENIDIDIKEYYREQLKQNK